jgi:hypothetical protein
MAKIPKAEFINGDFGIVIDGCNELERQMMVFGSIGRQESRWHLFQANGEALTDGANSIYELIKQLGELP